MADSILQVTLTEDQILNKIYYIRGQKVMLDQDLADLYDVPTKRLNEQVKRNKDRFPADFMFTSNHYVFSKVSVLASPIN
jgi:hypothetical protein